tara:strand:+ start:4022 stop:4678 length:657 start_codon:yes stop_codon:yes gene_type:complete
MKILVFDTETTGLPSERNASIRDVTKWPHIIQLSYILYDVDMKKTLCCVDDIIKLDDNVEISEKSIELHNITRSISNRKGILISEAINNFNMVLETADVVVAHNLSFDKKMIMVECVRLNTKQYFTNTSGRGVKEYCSMKNSVELCKIERVNSKGEKYYKYPTLSELHNYLFGYYPENVHDSMADVLICLRCYYKMFKEIDILTNGCSIIKKLYKLYN